MEKMFKYELHCHCSEVSPCGWLNAEELVKLYVKAGYAGIVITDHFRSDIIEMLPGRTWREKVISLWEPYKRVKQMYAGENFFIGRGMELRFDDNENDFLLYGFSEELFREEGESWTALKLSDFFERYHNDMLILQAHPNREGSSHPESVRYLHGIEVKNTNPRHNNHNEISLETAFACPNLIATGGSDCHREEDAARGGIETEVPVRSERQLEEILRNRNFRII